MEIEFTLVVGHGTQGMPFQANGCVSQRFASFLIEDFPDRVIICAEAAPAKSIQEIVRMAKRIRLG